MSSPIFKWWPSVTPKARLVCPSPTAVTSLSSYRSFRSGQGRLGWNAVMAVSKILSACFRTEDAQEIAWSKEEAASLTRFQKVS